MSYLVFENKHYILKIDERCRAESLIHKESGEECLKIGANVPLFAITELRPYNNEIKLAHPNKRTVFKANRVRLEDGVLVVGFNLITFEARVGVSVKDDYIAFELLGYNIKKEDFGGLHMTPPPVEAFKILNLPIKERKYFGEWLNVVSDENIAVAVVSTSPYALIDSEERDGYRLLTAEAERSVKLEGTGAALIATSADKMLDCLASIEEDFDLPKGVASRKGDLIDASVFWTSQICPENADKIIAYAKAGGFKLMLIYYQAFEKDCYAYTYCGDYDYNERYPNGDEDVKLVLDKIHAAGMRAGLHFLQTHIGKGTRYITPVCDHRLNLTKHFTLARPVSADDSVIYVEENPLGTTMHEDTRVLKFDGELIHYESYTTEWPYRFEGCKRGHWDTTVIPHNLGTIGGILDISEFCGVSAYINQYTSLQDEIADKIAHIYNLGFEFAYFDGSEGTNPPYDFHVANAQYRVYKKFNKAPLFCEGAAKSHFSWHMISGGNAFDIFSDEEFKDKLIEWPFTEAGEMLHDYTRVNFGWWEFRTTTQPDFTEFGISRAASYNCPATYLVSLDKIDNCPRRPDVLEVMRRWEDVREKRLLTAEQKMALRDTSGEHIMLINESGEYELAEYAPLKDVAGGDGNVRAFTFNRLSKSYAVIWHTAGEGELFIPMSADEYEYEDELGGERPEKKAVDGGSVVHISKRRYISTSLPSEELAARLKGAKII